MIDPAAGAAALVARYLGHIEDHEPIEATRLGLEGRDGDLPDLDAASLEARSRGLAALADEVERTRAAIVHEPEDVDAATGAATGRAAERREALGDLTLLGDELTYRRFRLDERPRFQTDPLAAIDAVSASIHELLRRGDVDEGERCRRVEAAAQRARRVPVLLEQAGSVLEGAPGPHLEVALQRLPGVIDLVREELPRRAEQLGVDVSPARDAGEVAAEGLEAFGALLDELRDEAPMDWRLGAADHVTSLRFGLGSAMGLVQVEDRARAWVTQVRGELAELAAATWARRFPGEPVPADPDERIARTLDAVADTAVGRDELVPEAQQAVDEARAFALATGLTDVPPAERLAVVEAPRYLRGIAVAFITQAPPLEPEGGCTFYLSPVPNDWSQQQARAFLREYTPAHLRSLAIHESYPGHFVQLEHASQHPRLARRLLTRPAFAEGWAVYIEREVAALGFGDGDTSSVDGDDYRIVHRLLELRIAMNALLDVGLHAGHLTDDEALAALTRTAFQTRAEAEGKLLRAKITPGQLSSYFVGGEELTDLRAEVEAHEGAAFDVRAFHQRALSHGTPTAAIVADALRADAPTRRPFARTA